LALSLLLVTLAPTSTAHASSPPALPVLDSSHTAPSPAAATLPSGFHESVALIGLTEPTAVRFASDGRVFVAEKSGIVKVFNNLTTPMPTVFADLRTNVHNFWDRGLLGLALAPNFPVQPWVYVLYTYDAAIGGTAPRWGTPGGTSDPCPTPPGPTTNGCVVSGRLSRLQATGNVATGPEQVLIEDWCQQYPSHSIGDLRFGPDGLLYVSGGEGASFSYSDYGQVGNPCGDPPGGTMAPPTAEGGSLRSQDLQTPSDPTTLDGAILRVDPTTGAPAAGNPGVGDANAQRIVGEGLRNPFRFTIRPGTGELWIGDVGANDWEEIDILQNPVTAPVKNFGWPCYEGAGRNAGFDSAGLDICKNLYLQGPGAVVAPFYTYPHSQTILPGESCPAGSSSITGLAFYTGGGYPLEYNGALFFADYSRNCIWAMLPGANGLPDPANKRTFVASASGPVDLEIGPAGDLFYVDFNGGTVRRITFEGPPPPPPPGGGVPVNAFRGQYYDNMDLTNLKVNRTDAKIDFDWGLGSPDPAIEPDTFSVRWTGNWDFSVTGRYRFTMTADDGMRVWADNALVLDAWIFQPATTYAVDVDLAAGRHLILVEYFDAYQEAVARVSWALGTNTPPTATIATPVPGTTWRVGDTIAFSGSATDAEDGPLPASALSWHLILHHCNPDDPTSCHTHSLQTFTGVANGSFAAPDHEYPSYLELQLTAKDSGGLTDVKSVLLYPQTSTLSFATTPNSVGLKLVVSGTARVAPFNVTAIVGSMISISAPSPQTVGLATYIWMSWSDGGAQTHNIVAGDTPATYTATFLPLTPAPLRSGAGVLSVIGPMSMFIVGQRESSRSSRLRAREARGDQD